MTVLSDAKRLYAGVMQTTEQTIDATSVPTPLTMSLASAWGERAERDLDHAMQASQAPALFKPEDVEATMLRARQASARSQRWATLGM